MKLYCVKCKKIITEFYETTYKTYVFIQCIWCGMLRDGKDFNATHIDKENEDEI